VEDAITNMPTTETMKAGKCPNIKRDLAAARKVKQNNDTVTPSKSSQVSKKPENPEKSGGITIISSPWVVLAVCFYQILKTFL